MNIKAKIIISRYKEDFSWIKEYTENYVVYNKGEPILGDSRILNVENIGGNQRDIFKFIVDNYENLPELMAFVQAYPFDHCNKEKFDKIIGNECFTALESYENLQHNGASRNDVDGGYMEINNSWYIPAHNATHNQTCKYSSFDQFMNQIFENYQHLEWIRFTPGSQYIIEKRQVLFYPKFFWKFLMDNLITKSPTEGHIIERALWNILQCKLVLRG